MFKPKMEHKFYRFTDTEYLMIGFYKLGPCIYGFQKRRKGDWYAKHYALEVAIDLPVFDLLDIEKGKFGRKIWRSEDKKPFIKNLYLFFFLTFIPYLLIKFLSVLGAISFLFFAIIGFGTFFEAYENNSDKNAVFYIYYVMSMIFYMIGVGASVYWIGQWF